jgi:hypothetical protein
LATIRAGLDGGGIDGRIGDRNENRPHRHDGSPLPTAVVNAGSAGLTLTPHRLTPRAARKVRCGTNRTLFLAEPLDFAQRIEEDLAQRRANWLGATVFNSSRDTDF